MSNVIHLPRRIVPEIEPVAPIAPDEPDEHAQFGKTLLTWVIDAKASKVGIDWVERSLEKALEHVRLVKAFRNSE